MAKKVESGQEITPRREEGRIARFPTRWSPFEEMERMFEDFFGRAAPRSLLAPLWEAPAAPAIHAPKIDVIDRENDVVVRAEIPGVKKEDIDVSTTANTVTIRGSTTEEKKEEGENYYRAEMSRGEFYRTISLPAQVDDSKATAKLENGILQINVPKVESSKRRSIKIE